MIIYLEKYYLRFGIRMVALGVKPSLEHWLTVNVISNLLISETNENTSHRFFYVCPVSKRLCTGPDRHVFE
jgi:hypothetical protein